MSDGAGAPAAGADRDDPADASRRRFLAGGAAALSAPALVGLGACARPDDWRTRVDGRWIGDASARGHRVRDASGPASSGARASPPPAVREHATDVLVIGGGIAGLAAARALVRAGVDRFAVLELEDTPGGNSRGHAMGGLRCPLGAHYLPLPGGAAAAAPVREWLVEAGLARIGRDGALEADERDLCHAPQERLFIDGAWQDGLLPAARSGSPALAPYRRFAALVAEAGRTAGFALPTTSVPWTDAHAALDAVTFAAWLHAQGLADARLLAYLDYCCRDDYGAGAATVSAWAGLHYFASRHGFAAPGDDANERDAILTWPEGNAHLVERLLAPVAARVHAGRAVFRLDETRDGVEALAFSGDDGAVERWTARQVVMAAPLFIAARVMTSPPPALASIAPRLRHAPWLVANLRLDDLPHDRTGAPLSWDNVIHGSPSLGYVNAQSQSLPLVVGPRLWTAYWSFPDTQRARLLAMPWQDATALILQDLSVVHPDLAQRLQAIDLVRHGHAMCIPAPGVRGHAALAALRPDGGRTGAGGGRVAFAHADLSAYSVFEEAFHHGDAAGRLAAARLRG
jgi:glycine/D-amino acid oxidase-like deaminating enzyme